MTRITVITTTPVMNKITKTPTDPPMMMTVFALVIAVAELL